MSTNLKILIGQTKAGKWVGFLLSILISTRLLIQANSGAGKSYLLRALMEQMFSHIQIICIDPEGEFSSLREKLPFVLVGKDGDTAADVRTAGLLAERLLELNTSAICDLYEMKGADRHLWVKNFLDAMINAPKKLWHPVIVIVDEAHMFCPEKGDSVAAQSMKDLCTRGRKRGFCAVFATQSLANLSKEATKMLQNRLVGGTFEDVDIKRAEDLLGILPENKREFSHTLRTMEPGWFYAFGRAISKERVMFKGRKAETTHASAGSGKHSAAPPPPPEKVRELLPRLADLPKEAADRAATVDDLKKQIRTLTGELAAAKRAVPIVKTAAPAGDVGASEAQVKRAIAEALKPWHKFTHDLARAHRLLKDKLEKITQLAGEAGNVFNNTVKVPENVPPPPLPVRGGPPLPMPAPSAVVAATNRVKVERAQRTDVVAGEASSLPGTSRRLLGILAQWFPEGMKRGQLAAMAGIKSSTGSFSNRLTDLRGPGYIREEGEMLYATEAGVDAMGGDIPPAPQTTDEVLAIWKPKLPGTSYKLLEVLVAAAGEPVKRADLAAAVDPPLSASTGSFSNRLTDLRTARLLVDAGQGMVAANKETLFLESAYA